jgi:predicted RNA-binding Zn-ribbon protein involved in translation (DUF1610 family)
MAEYLKHTCVSCGIEFTMPRPPGVLDSLFSRKKYFPLEDFTHVSCPNCNTVQLATERRFFGVLGPRGLQVIDYFLAGIMLVLVLNVLFDTFWKRP